MLRVLLLFFTVFLCIHRASSYGSTQCYRENEEEKLVSDCPPEKTCKTKDVMYDCPQSVTPKQKKCICKEGFYRNLDGNCITGELCDRCPGENEYFSCGSACDNVCSTLDVQNKTNCPIVNIVCNNQCYCEDGYARNDNNECIPIEKCHSGCGENEEPTDCKKSCPPDTCFSLVARFKCDSKEPCRSGCACKSGHLRRTSKSPCMPIKKCPELANSPDFN